MVLGEVVAVVTTRRGAWEEEYGVSQRIWRIRMDEQESLQDKRLRERRNSMSLGRLY
jgi:hypothetical protein